MKARIPLMTLLLAVAVGGCAKEIIKPPKENTVKLGNLTATYRNWGNVDLCLVDPKTVEGDLSSLNAMMADYLGHTSAPADGMWADEHIELLEAGTKELPAPMKSARRLFQLALKAQCKFQSLGDAKKLVPQVEKRIEDAPELLVQVKAFKAVAKWKAAVPAAIEAAKEQHCAPPAKGAKPPKLEPYYAFDDETGKTEWLFCDGGKVVASPGNEPKFEPGPEPAPVKGKKPPKPTPPAEYLAAAAARPAEAIDRAPRLASKVAKKADDGQPEPKDEPAPKK